ncbi:MAG: deoxynucleoside kinase [Bacteroidales bacterium]|nr:deoxynucleoside kinase [Bacteroidales bacterium]
MKIPYNYVVVEGSIGAGKTTLTTMLAADLNAELVLERFADNPFLEKFYKDPEHYSFPVEMTFLMDRYQQLKNLLTARDLFTDFVIGDYFIDKCLLFSKNNLSKDEFSLFKTVFDTIAGFLPKPDLIIYLYTKPDRLLKQIAKRNRSFEKDITIEYLTDIQEKYLTYFRENQQIPILLVDTENIDFVENKSDYQHFKELITNQYPAGIHRIIF